MKTRVRGISDDEMLEKFPTRGRTPGWFFRVASPTGGPCLDLAKSGDPTVARQRLLDPQQRTSRLPCPLSNGLRPLYPQERTFQRPHATSGFDPKAANQFCLGRAVFGREQPPHLPEIGKPTAPLLNFFKRSDIGAKGNRSGLGKLPEDQSLAELIGCLLKVMFAKHCGLSAMGTDKPNPYIVGISIERRYHLKVDKSH